MNISPSILHAIGKTPLVRLNKVVPEGAATVLAKCEFMNPTGSIKDRMAAYILDEARRRGELRPGGVIVENTSGNTGLGVAMWAAVNGYRCVFTMPDKMSLEKVNMLKAFGAEVVITPTDVPGDSPEHYVNVAKRIAAENPGGFYVNQYHAQTNIDAHEKSTGAEVFADTDGGKFDAFVAAAGTGGTLSGVGRFMKKNAPHVKIVGVDPIGSVHYHYFYTRTLPTPHVYKVEGAGEDILCDAMDFSVVDEFFQVSDKESFLMARRLVREEGLFCGGSSGSNVHIAVEVAKKLGPGKTVITVLPDSATRYTTKHLSDAWMRDYGFLEATPDLGLVEDLLAGKPQQLVTTPPTATVGEIVSLLRAKGVSQIPVLAGGGVGGERGEGGGGGGAGGGRPTHIVHEADILHALHQGKATMQSPVSAVATEIGGLIYPKARLEELYSIFEKDRVAVVVDGSRLVGIISQIDLIEYLSKRGR